MSGVSATASSSSRNQESNIHWRPKERRELGDVLRLLDLYAGESLLAIPGIAHSKLGVTRLVEPLLKKLSHASSGSFFDGSLEVRGDDLTQAVTVGIVRNRRARTAPRREYCVAYAGRASPSRSCGDQTAHRHSYGTRYRQWDGVLVCRRPDSCAGSVVVRRGTRLRLDHAVSRPPRNRSRSSL